MDYLGSPALDVDLPSKEYATPWLWLHKAVVIFIWSLLSAPAQEYELHFN